MKPIFLGLWMTLAFYNLQAQSTFLYPVSKNYASPVAQWRRDLKARHDQQLSAVKGPYGAEIKQFYQERFLNIDSMMASGKLLEHPEAQAYLSALVNLILEANPQVNRKLPAVFFSRAYWPNAVSMGDGTIFINAGLFHRLQNESQLAFVVCHELAHYWLDHGNRSIETYVSKINSDEFQRKLRQIKNSEYMQGMQLENLLTGIVFNSRRHSRGNETAADSMAIVLLQKTPFSLDSALRVMDILDQADEDRFVLPSQLEATLNQPQYPFQQRWVKERSSLIAQDAGLQDAKLIDSLKTHPDCSKRKASMSVQIKGLSQRAATENPISFAQFQYWKQYFDLDIVAYAFEQKEMSRSLYLAIQTLAVYPKHPFLIKLMAQGFDELYTHQQAHRLSEVTDLPAPYRKPTYNRLLTFIQRLRLEELAAIQYYFQLSHAPAFEQDAQYKSLMQKAYQRFNP